MINRCSGGCPNLPVLDFEALVQPPAEKHWLCRNFLYVHAVEVYVDPGTFFAQEFCQTHTKKKKETKQKQEETLSDAARRVEHLEPVRGGEDKAALQGSFDWRKWTCHLLEGRASRPKSAMSGARIRKAVHGWMRVPRDECFSVRVGLRVRRENHSVWEGQE